MTTKVNGSSGVDRVQAEAYTGNAGILFDWAGSVPPVYAIEIPKVPTNALRATYPELFAAIGTTWGTGDGSTSFGLPYMAADEVGVRADTAGDVGTVTAGQVLAHTHSTTYASAQVAAGTASASVSSSGATTRVTATQTPVGGTKNLAAGMRVMKCVRIR